MERVWQKQLTIKLKTSSLFDALKLKVYIDIQHSVNSISLLMMFCILIPSHLCTQIRKILFSNKFRSEFNVMCNSLQATLKPLVTFDELAINYGRKIIIPAINDLIQLRAISSTDIFHFSNTLLRLGLKTRRRESLFQFPHMKLIHSFQTIYRKVKRTLPI